MQPKLHNLLRVPLWSVLQANYTATHTSIRYFWNANPVIQILFQDRITLDANVPPIQDKLHNKGLYRHPQIIIYLNSNQLVNHAQLPRAQVTMDPNAWLAQVPLWNVIKLANAFAQKIMKSSKRLPLDLFAKLALIRNTGDLPGSYLNLYANLVLKRVWFTRIFNPDIPKRARPLAFVIKRVDSARWVTNASNRVIWTEKTSTRCRSLSILDSPGQVFNLKLFSILVWNP
jgi:hypothetical protein